ncbi:MAG: AAA family ATPase [Candidatus Uhrbacteria bacterium]|nr:AAA family ATPase [Candidatus Uhrbacteria bacterium]
MKLKGFKGIRSGSGKDELELDISEWKGLVAVTGPNGSGKTTVLDNLHPYRVMPYRAGSYSPKAFSFYNECYGSDASKELVFELNGARYRSLVLIDADRKKQEAYLYEQADNGWKALCDGKTDNYDKSVEELIGSPQLFFTSVFRCQDAARLSDYTKGEIKDIFVELLGIESLKAQSQRAKERKEAFAKEAEWLRRERERLAAVLDEGKKAEAEAKRLDELSRELTNTLSRLDDEAGDKQAELRRIEAKAALDARSLEERNAIELKARDIRDKLRRTKDILSRAQLVKNASADVKQYQRKAEALKKDLADFDAALAGFQERERDCRDAEKKLLMLRKSLDELRIMKKHSEDVSARDLRLAKETSELLGKVPCESEYHKKCPLLINAVKAQESIPAIMARLQASGAKDGKEKDLQREIDLLQPRVPELTDLQLRMKEAVSKRRSISKELAETEAQGRKAGDLAKHLPEVEFAESIYPGLVSELKDLEAVLESFMADERPFEKVNGAEKELGLLKSKRQEYLERLTEVKKLLGGVEKKLADGEAAEKELKAIEGRLKALNEDISEWALLEKAFGNDGIVALEIDDAGPAISAAANDLLSSCFGTRFSVKIDTQAAKADGKGLKETFDITVYDALRDESKSLRTMSGGEKVWIEEAITRAISFYNARRSGRRYQALFTDEKDGALDFKRKKEFIAMKKRVLDLGGYEMEFFISHSPDVQDVADSRIQL